MNTQYRKALTGTQLQYFDAREAVEAIHKGAWAGLPYTSRVLAENLVRRCDPDALVPSLKQLIELQARPRLPMVPRARGVPRHPGPDRAGRPGRTARRHRGPGRRSAPGQSGGTDPARGRPLAGRGMRRLRPGRVREEPRLRRTPQRRPLRLHQLDQGGVPERRRDPARERHPAPDQPGADVAGRSTRSDGVAFPDTLVGTDSATRRTVDALGVVAVGVGGLEAEKRDVGARVMDAPARDRRRRPSRASASDRASPPPTWCWRSPSSCASPRWWATYLEFFGEGAASADARRPRHHLQHGARVRRHRGDVQPSTRRRSPT